jgi:FkbM family methyltransferase
MLVPKRLFRALPASIHGQLSTLVRSNRNGRDFAIPVIKRHGLANLDTSPYWMEDALARLLPLKPGVFVDVGANLGQTLIQFIGTGIRKPYLGFEPNAFCAAYIEELIEANGFSDCTILPVGLSNSADILRFYREPTSWGLGDAMGTLVRDMHLSEILISTNVVVQPFDTVSEMLSLADISVMKIDVEGGELEVVEGMGRTMRSQRPILLCEVLLPLPGHDFQERERRNKALMNTLEAAQYAVAQIKKPTDESRVLTAVPISTFPMDLWTPALKHLSDYVFYPTEDEAKVLSALR